MTKSDGDTVALLIMQDGLPDKLRRGNLVPLTGRIGCHGWRPHQPLLNAAVIIRCDEDTDHHARIAR